MSRNKFISIFLLAPISFLYGIGVALRNWMYNHGILHSHEFDIPVVVVGNLAVGGTGKTPHTEYIVDTLRYQRHMAVLSRGYRRHTSGFRLATPKSTFEEIGDEPMQIYRKFGRSVKVAVCENRVKGIQRLRELDPKIDMVVLDDAFQHRRVKPALSIVLVDFAHPVYEDSLLPYGRLREPARALNRADIVVVTKCPGEVKPMDLRIIRENLGLYPYQKLFFSAFEYGEPVPLFPECKPEEVRMESLTQSDTVLSLTGIENPRPFIRHIRSCHPKVKIKRYNDHHQFTPADFTAIAGKFDAMKGRRRLIFTTEKDSMRLRGNSAFPDSLKPYIYYIPVKVRFILASGEPTFEATIAQLLKQKNF